MKKILLSILVLTLTGCTSGNGDKPIKEDKKTMSVTASFYPLAFVSQRVGGKLVKVNQIIPGGVEPHDYEPTPQDLAAINNSQVFIMNGGGLDAWADSIPNAVRVNPANISDPHVWLDPIGFQSEVEVVREAFIKADPANTAKYVLNAAGLINDLRGLDQEFKDGLKECKIKQIITSHDAFGHIAKRYGFESLAIAGISPDEEPSPKRLAELSDLAKKNSIKYIFFETLVSPKLADTIANEIGAKSLVLNPIEGVTSEEAKQGKDYLVLMQENLKNLRTAMQCK
jgi:zinc transport system substrate-binding protein